jgi:hypothetical protein
MPLPPDFTFSQNNLQTFVDCPRRFELAYIKQQRWPAVQVEPVLEHERHLEMGARFHQLVFQHKQGLPVEVLTAAISDPDTLHWWNNYLKYAPADLPPTQLPEYDLSMPFAGYRLMARYDLLAVDPGRQVVIVDWKTAMKQSPAYLLAARVQTRLYPFILANTPTLCGDLPRDRISMLYWFPNFPHDPIPFAYSADKCEQDRSYFSNLISDILHTPDDGFPITSNTRTCFFCTYRSLCDRGNKPGDLAEMEGEADQAGSLFAGIDLDQIPGIAF